MLRCAAGTTVRAARGAVRLSRGDQRWRFTGLPDPMPRLLRRLATDGATRDALAQAVPPSQVARLKAILAELEAACVLCYEIRDDAGTVARLVPMAPAYREQFAVRSRGARVLSRFASLRRDGTGFVLESPLAHARVELAARALQLLTDLAQPRPATASAFTTLLDAAGMLTGVTAVGDPAEDQDGILPTWEPADLAFHARSRLGRHDGPAGATFDHLDRVPPLPAVKPPMSPERLALPRPDLAVVIRRDPPFGDVLEGRRSIRRFTRPLTLEQLGEFLYRVARVRAVHDATDALPCETSSRPYPSGGACYPLELYLAVRAADGLAAGLYHYDPLAHELETVDGGAKHVEPLLADTRVPLAPDDAPVLFMITARFPRVSWKYRAMAYSTVLKDVGVLMQTMYLVATAMHLAPCAVGCGDAERSARALGTRFEEESSVGEFLLGRAD